MPHVSEGMLGNMQEGKSEECIKKKKNLHPSLEFSLRYGLVFDINAGQLPLRLSPLLFFLSSPWIMEESIYIVDYEAANYHCQFFLRFKESLKLFP